MAGNIRTQVLATFTGLSRTWYSSISEKLVLISGDLFDCPVPAPASLQAVQNFFTKLQSSGVATVILPGARDPENIFNAAHQPDNRDICPGAFVLSPEQPVARLEALKTTVCLLTLPDPAAETPTSLPRQDDGMIAIGMCYRPTNSTVEPVALAPYLAGTGVRYIGIGGDTRYSLIRTPSITVCSPGVPEPIDWGQERGSVALVQIGDRGEVKVDRRHTGGHTFARREFRGRHGEAPQDQPDAGFANPIWV